MPIESYHMIWLASHPNRTLEWLQERMRDGFDVHHLDGDHGNDAAENLVLIECLDHMRLHGTSWNRMVRHGKSGRNIRQKRIPCHGGYGGFYSAYCRQVEVSVVMFPAKLAAKAAKAVRQIPINASIRHPFQKRNVCPVCGGIVEPRMAVIPRRSSSKPYMEYCYYHYKPGTKNPCEGYRMRPVAGPCPQDCRVDAASSG